MGTCLLPACGGTSIADLTPTACSCKVRWRLGYFTPLQSTPKPTSGACASVESSHLEETGRPREERARAIPAACRYEDASWRSHCDDDDGQVFLAAGGCLCQRGLLIRTLVCKAAGSQAVQSKSRSYKTPVCCQVDGAADVFDVSDHRGAYLG